MDRSSRQTHNGITGRVVLLALFLVAALVFWSEYVEIRVAGPDMIATSLPLCALFALLVIRAGNGLLSRLQIRKMAALSPKELLALYLISAAGVAPCGIGQLQWLVPTLVARAGGSDPRWRDTDRMLPDWSRVTDPVAARAFYDGRALLSTHWHSWALPVLVWSLFLFALYGVTFCLAVLFRRAWVEEERLPFPLVQIPLELTGTGDPQTGARPRAPLHTQPVFLAGAALAVAVQTLAALHSTVLPSLAWLPVKPGDTPDVGGLTGRPWEALGSLPLTFYPFVIGIAFLLPTDVSLSCWAFFLLGRLEAVAFYSLGIGDSDGSSLWSQTPPRLGDQGMGAFLGMAVLSGFSARRHLARTWRFAAGSAVGTDYTDSNEALSYRAAWAGLAGGIVVLIGFGCALGIPFLLALLFLGLYLLIVLAFARIRAEAGIPWGYGPATGATGLLIDGFGSSHFQPGTLGALSGLVWMDHDYRSTEMPFQMEALRGASSRRLAWALAAALIVGIGAGWFSQLSLYYHYGADNGLTRTGYGAKWPRELTGWLSDRRPMDAGKLGATLLGAGVVLALSVLRTRIPGWPLNPVGYAVAGTWTMQWIWFPMLLGWLVKSVILRYGGMGGYRAALPFFFGLIVGDYAVSGALALIYTITGLPGYRTFPI